MQRNNLNLKNKIIISFIVLSLNFSSVYLADINESLELSMIELIPNTDPINNNILSNGNQSKRFDLDKWSCQSCYSPDLYIQYNSYKNTYNFQIKNTSTNQNLIVQNGYPSIKARNSKFNPILQKINENNILEKFKYDTISNNYNIENNDQKQNKNIKQDQQQVLLPDQQEEFQINIQCVDTKKLNQDNYWTYITISLQFMFEDQIITESCDDSNNNANFIYIQNKLIENTEQLKQQQQQNNQQNSFLDLQQQKQINNNQQQKQTFQTIEINYLFVCEEGQRFPRFDWSIPIIIVISSVSIFVIAFGEKIVSFKSRFMGIRITWIHALIYVIVEIIIMLSYIGSHEASSIMTIILLIPMQLFSVFFIVCELIFLTPFKCSVLIYKRFCIRHVIGVIISLILNACYMFLGQPWWLNDLISLCLTGCFLKIFKVRSMKDSCTIMGIVMMYEIIVAVTMHYVLTKFSYEVILMQTYNSPIFLEIPIFMLQLYKRCTWVPLSVIIFPGVFLAYCHRFDITQNSNRFTLISFLGLMTGMFIWMFSTVWNTHAWPISAFAYSFMCIFIIGYSLMHAQFKTIWEGMFYDSAIQEPQILDDYIQQAQLEQERMERSSLDQNLLSNLRIQSNEYKQQTSLGNHTNRNNNNNDVIEEEQEEEKEEISDIMGQEKKDEIIQKSHAFEQSFKE